MLVELCLLIPAPLSSLLQHLSLLLQPVILALRSRDELAHLGLRTLELWIDSLNPDYLYPIMSTQPSLSELMRSLCDLLRPDASTLRGLALRLLGKLGGRNRWFLNESSRLNSLNESKSSFGMNLNIEGTWNLSVPFDQVSSSIVSFMEEHLDVSNTSLSHEYDQISPPAKALIVSSASTLKWNRSGSSDNATSNTTFVQTRRSKRARTSTNLGASLLRRDCDDERDDDETKRRNFIPHPRENYVAQLPRATFLKYKEHAVEVSRAFLASVLSISSSSSSMSQDLMDVAKGVRNIDVSTQDDLETKHQDDQEEEIEDIIKRLDDDVERKNDST